MEFEDLESQAFELLIGLLLVREGLDIVHIPRDYSGSGPDFEARSSEGSPVFVEVKHFRRSNSVPVSTIEQFLGELSRIRRQRPRAKAFWRSLGA